MATVSGGDKLQSALQKISDKLGASGGGPSVAVGYLEGTTYPDLTSLPMVAATMEFGGTINRAAATQTIHRLKNAKGAFLRKGRFVKASKANHVTTHAVGAYTITIPPLPYFRPMIASKGPTWGKDIARLLKKNNYDGPKTLKGMGEIIQGQLRASIDAVTSPPLKASTIRRKGFSKPLIDSGVMRRDVDYKVTP